MTWALVPLAVLLASAPVLLGEFGVVLAAMALLEVSWHVVGRRLGLRQIRPPPAPAHR